MPVAVIDGQQQREGRTIVSKPPVVATVHLYQHALAGHPLPADTVPGRADGGAGSSSRHPSVCAAAWFDRSLCPRAP